MKTSAILKTILMISGVLATAIGMVIVARPVAFYAGNGLDLSGQAGLLNEIRASGSFPLASGLLILSGAFMRNLTFTSYFVDADLKNLKIIKCSFDQKENLKRFIFG